MRVEKVWLRNYPVGVPAEVNPDEYASLVAMFAESCERFAGSPAYSNMGRTISYADLDRLSLHFASWLQQVAGLKKGDRIALMMPNLLQYPIAVFGALRAGLAIVNTNPLYTHRELAHQLNDSGATAIVILENFAHVLAEVMHETPIKTVIVASVGDQLAFPKSIVANLVVRHVRKQVPSWNIPGAIRFNRVLNEGRFQTLDGGSNTVGRLGYGSGPEPAAQATDGDELDPTVLDSVHLAGARFERMLKRLMGV